MEEFEVVSSFVSDSIERGCHIKREIEVYKSSSCDLLFFNPKFRNIQSGIKITKKIYNPKTGLSSKRISYFIANFRDSASVFNQHILDHWKVETNHYYRDTMLDEDSHSAFINPYTMTVLRSFAINFYQLNRNLTGKKMIGIQRDCHHSDEFVASLFEV